MSALRIDWFTAFLAVISALGAALVLLREVNYGVGLSPDSVLYLSTARNLLEGNGFVYYWGTYLNAPPIYPLILAFSGLFGTDVVAAAGHVNAAAFGLTIFAMAMWLRSRVQSRFLVVWASLACALLPPLVYVSTYAWTEPLFILFTVLSLFALDRFLDTRQRLFLVLAAVCATLACLTRYPGVIVIASAFALLALQRGVTFPEKIKDATVYFAIAIVPISGWMLRNFLISGSLSGKYSLANILLLLGVAAVASALLLLLRNTECPAKIRKAAFAIAIVPISGWMLGSFLISGSLIGKAYSIDFPPLSVLHTVATEFGRTVFGGGGFKLLELGFANIFGVSISREPTVAGVSLMLAALLLLAVAVAYSLLRLNRNRQGLLGEGG